MNDVDIKQSLEAARPMLVLIQDISHDIPRSSYVVYYRNYTQKEGDAFKNIDSLKELFLLHEELEFKIINFQDQKQAVFVKCEQFKVWGEKIIIEATFKQFSIRLQGKILNKSESHEGVVDLSLLSKKGYDQFYKFRKKFKTLQNITKSIDFKIDHRIRMSAGGKEYQFDLEERKQEHFYLGMEVFEQPIRFYLEEITSIQDFSNADSIAETEVSVKQILGMEHSYIATINYNNMFKAEFLLDVIRNQNISSSEMTSIRVFQTSKASKQVRIGSERTINLPSCLQVNPLIDSKYYDFEWGHLNQNLSKIEESGSNEVYQHLPKISKSTETYPHFLNQEIVDVHNCNFLIFQIDGEVIKIPIIFILQGFNYIQNNKVSIKFFVDSVKVLQKGQVFDKKSGHRRVYEMNFNGIVNMSKINQILDRNGAEKFTVKIVNEETFYYIPFERIKVGRSQFRKEGKELATKQQITIKNGNKTCWLINSKSKDQITLVQTQGIAPYYVIQMTSSSSLSFQVLVNGSIQLQGSLLKEKIFGSQGKQFMHLMSALEGSAKMGVALNFVPIHQANQSASTYFCFKQRLSFAEAGVTDEVSYQIQVEFEKGSKMKSLRSKLHPQLKQQSASEGIFLKEFNGSSGVLSKENTLNFTLKVRKMFYNEELNYFDNEVLATKAISINPGLQAIKEGKSLLIKIQSECFQGVEIDLYDANIKKRLKYYLEIYASKNQFLDHRDSSYRFKVPSPLWNGINIDSSQINTGVSWEVMVHLNRKKNNTGKFTFPSNYQQEFILDHYNYNDGISVIKNGNDVGYSKFIRAIKLRCDVVGGSIGWAPQSDWYFGVLSLSQGNFYFLAQRMFDPYEDKGQDSDGSRKTVSRGQSARSDKHKIDPLAKTMGNMDLFKLKKKKNQLVIEGRQLTARYVKRQEKIVDLTKKIEEIDERTRKREQEEQDKKVNYKAYKKENVKMKEFYRSICECGQRNPEFNGYCGNCLKRLKQKYEIFYKDYKQKSYSYEAMVFDEYNQKQKIERTKRRLQGLQGDEAVIDTQDSSNNAEYLMRNMEEKSLRKCIEELRVELFELEEERSSLLQNSNWQMKILQTKISDQDSSIYRFSQEYDLLKSQLAELSRSIKAEESSSK